MRLSLESRLALTAGVCALLGVGVLGALDLRRETRAHHRVERLAAERHRATERALAAWARVRERELDALQAGVVREFGTPTPWEPLSLDDQRRIDGALDRSMRALPADSALRSAQVLTREGAVIASADRITTPAGCPSAVSQRPLALASLRLATSHGQDCEALAQSASIEPAAPPSAWGAVLLAMLSAAAAFGAVWRVARSITRRTELVTIALTRVGAGDLDVRVRPRGDDPIGALMAAFNLTVEELALSRARIDYLQRIAGWQEFARRLAHEIKNPLTPIQLAVQEVARKYAGDDAKFKRTLTTAREVVEEEIATLRRLVGAFSDFAKLPEVKTMPGDLAEFVRDAASSRAFLDEAAGADRTANVKVEFAAGEAPIPVAIDRMMLRRAFENLVRNAAQAIEHRALKGGVAGGTVWVRAERRPPRKGAEDEGEQAWLVVEDDGPGIPPEHAAKVFDPYFTTKSEGTGLGLAIVRKIALDHDGDVGLEAREGGGARFVITLPVREHGRTPRLSFVTFSGRAGGHPTAVEVKLDEKR